MEAVHNANDRDLLHVSADRQSARERLLSLQLVAEDKRRQSARNIQPRSTSEGLIPLSFAQERLWLLNQIGLVGSAYNAPFALRLSGNLLERALERSFTELLRRHEALRTRFVTQEGVPYQVIDPPEPLPIHRIDLSGVADATLRERDLLECMQKEQTRRFDLSEGPLLRCSLIALGPEEHVLFVTTHHIVVDGWSLGVIVHELSALYAAYAQDRPSPLPELKIQYADYAIWQRQWLQGDVLQEQLQYWREQLSGAPPELALPTDRPRPEMESFQGATLSFQLPATLSNALRDLARAEGATLFMVALAAFQLLLARWSGQRDIVVGSPIAGRRNQETEGLIGFFVNTLALRTDLSGNPSFRSLLGHVKEVTLGAYAHQDLPFEAVVAELRPDRTLRRQPIFQVWIALQNYPEESVALPGLTWTWTGVDWTHAHFDLALYLYEGSDGISAILEYATDLFEAQTIERIASHFRTLLLGIVADPDCPIGELQLMDEAERRLLAHWNETAKPYPCERLLHELFLGQVQLTPDAVAIEYGEKHLTYAQLNAQTNQLARYLANQGVGPDRLVAVCLERSSEMVVALLGILKAGGAYVPLDPSYPADRLSYMVSDARPHLILSHTELRSGLPPDQSEVVGLDTLLKHIAARIDEDLERDGAEQTGESLAYVIYTSGSTGRPKGTAMPHRALINLIEWHRAAFREEDRRARVLQFAALSFDVAFQEIFSTLCSGGTLLLIDEWNRRDPLELSRFLLTRDVQRLFLPPLMLQSLAEQFKAFGGAPAGLRDVITAGEQLKVSPEIVWLFEQVPSCRLSNHYGPTETHVVTAVTLEGHASRWPPLPPIGRPISNIQISVLDENLRAVPIGIVGEIYVQGAALARGYFQRPALTDERFVQLSSATQTPIRAYRTGDLARWRPDGTLEYLGRNDDQVKLRGYRIELGEIEAALMTHECVRHAAVALRERAGGEKGLVAYVAPRERSAPSIDALRAYLQARLPEHMVPAAFIVLDRLPITPSGKLDRRALPAAPASAYTGEGWRAPNGETERELARIWAELLGESNVSAQDNFFALGGHSLHAMRMITRIAERFAVHVHAIAIFQHPTIERMARHIEGLQLPTENETDGPRIEATPPSDVVQHSGAVPLAFSQLSHWKTYRLHERRGIRWIARATRLCGPLKVDALSHSFAELVRRHEALRTRIIVVDGVPAQEVIDAPDCRLEIEDLTGLDDATRDSELTRRIDKFVHEPIDVTVGPLFGARLYKLAADEHVLLMAMEHMISDGCSLGIVHRDIFAFYEAETMALPLTLPPVAMQLPEYARWCLSGRAAWLEAHGAYWNEQLLRYPRVTFPSDTAPTKPGDSGWGTIPFRLESGLKADLFEWCRCWHSTPAMSVFAAFACVTLRWCEVDEAVFQYQSDGRVLPELENTVGFIASMLYVRVELLHNDSFVALLQRVTEEYCRAYEHIDLSYTMTHTPRPGFTRNAAFNWVPLGSGFGSRREEGQGKTISRVPVRIARPVVTDLVIDNEPALLVFEEEEALVGELQFPLSRFSFESMSAFAQALTRTVEALLRQPERRLTSVPLRGIGS
jgi:surfactin family lipopeptide synthetase A